MNNAVYSGLHATDYAGVQSLCCETLAEIVAFFHPALGNCKFLLYKDYEEHIRCELSVSAWMTKEDFYCDEAFASQVIRLLEDSGIQDMARNAREAAAIPVKAVWKKVWWKDRNYAACWAAPETAPVDRDLYDRRFCSLLEQLAALVHSQQSRRLQLIVPFFDQVRTYQSTQILVGRHPKCDLVFRGRPEHRRISREHAAFLLIRESWYVQDLGSVNGTWLNGKRLEPGICYPIARKDIIKFAGAECVVVDTLFSAARCEPFSPREEEEEEILYAPISRNGETPLGTMDFPLGSYQAEGDKPMERSALYNADTHRVQIVTRCVDEQTQVAWIELPDAIRTKEKLVEYLNQNYSQLGIRWEAN